MRLTKTQVRAALKLCDIDVNNKFLKILYEDMDERYLVGKAFEQLKFAVVGGMEFDEEKTIETVQILLLAMIKAKASVVSKPRNSNG